MDLFEKSKLRSKEVDLSKLLIDCKGAQSVLCTVTYNITKAWDEGNFAALAVNGRAVIACPATTAAFRTTVDLIPFMQKGNNSIVFVGVVLNFNRWQSNARVTILVDGKQAIDQDYSVPQQNQRQFQDTWNLEY